MNLSKTTKIQAAMLNKLQNITTFVDLCLDGKEPSKKLLCIARKDLKKLENDVGKLEKLFGQGRATFGEFEQRFDQIIAESSA